MPNGKFVAYYRVSSVQQGRSGLGLQAQEESVRSYLNGGNWTLMGSFTEIESGKRNDRAALAQALAMCRLHNATLIIGKLDRLARNTLFLLTIHRDSGEAGVVFCDLPNIPAGPVGKFMITQMAAVAELEGGLISQRTKAALQAAKARGVVLGCRNNNIARYASVGSKAGALRRSAKAEKRAADLLPSIRQYQAEGAVTLRQIARRLNKEGIQTARGGEWSAVQVQRVMR
jgi:DNA invertase Pin-like site-specific DNA recombinase